MCYDIYSKLFIVINSEKILLHLFTFQLSPT